MGRFISLISICTLLLIFLVIFTLSHEKTLVTHPKGLIAHQELNLITVNTICMLIIILPTAILLLAVAWRYRASGQKKYEPESTYGPFFQFFLWTVPSIVVAIMALINWRATYALDPYKPLEHDVKPFTIQVVALDWKWLFIYPEQKIATLNFVQFPERTPIRFELAADGSPMNSFWIPELSGQIYCMTGMVTPLHLIADGSGEYSGKAAEINGDGYAKMTFTAKSTSLSDFEEWVEEVKKSELQLTDDIYHGLVKPSEKNPVTYYSNVDDDLFKKIVMKYSRLSLN